MVILHLSFTRDSVNNNATEIKPGPVFLKVIMLYGCTFWRQSNTLNDGCTLNDALIRTSSAFRNLHVRCTYLSDQATAKVTPVRPSALWCFIVP